MSSMIKISIFGAALLLASARILVADSTPLDTHALATLAVQDHGRKKPFTTFAYESLLTMSGTSTLPVEENGVATKLSPERVMLDLWFKPEGWDERPAIMVTFRALKEKLGLPLESDKKLFSYKQLIGQPALLDLLDQAQKLRQDDKGQSLSNLQKEAEHLGERLRLFQDCVNGQRQMIVPNAVSAAGRWAAIQDIAPGLRIWPPTEAGASAIQGPASGQAVAEFTAWYQAYRAGDIAQFNTLTPQVVDALRLLAPQFYPPAASLQFEHHYMTLHPFRWAWIVYLLTLIVLLLTGIWGRDIGYRLTWIGALAGLGLEAYGLACRVIISGRPPVTNMYETVIWVSFVGMVFASILESVYRKRYFFYAGLPASILTLIIADSQPTILDASINPLTAVLRNNMWLTIHVLTIVSSYAAFVLTAALGHIALVMSFWGRRYAKSMAEVQFFIYRAMQIGVLLLAAGTILGGVWANYSWGRFWGWDPKETWALVTLLCYLSVLHGRLAGWWGGFGLAIGSVACLLSVVMSWYGVNFVLGKGLHSYGFGTGGFSYVAVFAAFEAAFVAFVIVWNRKYGWLRPVARVPSPPQEDGLAPSKV
jgi:ABC-type transport system involved in cytochrome c biogenesis permease subunit